MTPEAFADLALSFPGVERGTSYGYPSFKLRGQFFTRIRLEDDSAVFQQVPFDEREMLVESDPAIFHFTDHYRGYPCVLARLSSLDEAQARGFLLRQWRAKATKAMLKAWDAATPGAADAR